LELCTNDLILLQLSGHYLKEKAEDSNLNYYFDTLHEEPVDNLSIQSKIMLFLQFKMIIENNLLMIELLRFYASKKAI